MSRIVFILLLVSVWLNGYGQETIIQQAKYAPGITETYHVLKTNPGIKNGIYQALYNKKIAIATGMYTNNIKTGMWHFYNTQGKVVQHYNFDKKQALLLVRDELPPNQIQYEFLPKPNDTDTLTLPVKIGGLAYGYLPYLNKFKVKNKLEYVEGSMFGILQILVSPSGRLAECVLLVKAKIWADNYWQIATIESYELKPELLSDDDKQFIPATVNGQFVPCTIYIYCNIAPSGRVSIN